MPFQRVPNTAELTIVGSMAGQLIINTYYAQYADPYDLTDLTALASVGDAWWSSDMQALVSDQYTYLRSHVQGLNAEIDFEAEDSTHTGDVGTADGLSCPNNVTLSIKRSSANTGRSARGRVFWPALVEGYLIDTAHINPVSATPIVTSLMNLHDAINDVGRTEVIVSRFHNGAKRAEAVTFDVVEYIVVDYALDSMRRRLAGRGV